MTYLSLGGSGVGIGIVFAGLVLSVARNPSLDKKLFIYAILGFALTEAIADCFWGCLHFKTYTPYI